MILEEGKLGGPQIYVERLAAASAKQVKTVVIVPTQNSTLFQNLLIESKLEFVSFNLTRITKEISVATRYVLFSWLEIYRLYKYFRSSQFDVIYVAGGAWQYKGLIAGKLARHKVIWHQNDTKSPRIFRLIFSALSRLADGFVYASKRTESYYRPLVKQGRYSPTHSVIPSPVDTKYFTAEQVSLTAKEMSAWEGKVVIGVIANVNPVKGLDVFVAVAAQLNRQLSDLQFVVVGPINKNQEKYASEIKSLCQGSGVLNIDFIGAKKDVRPILARMDLYLCTSIAESSPISVWEAMSMGVPVVSTDVGDVGVYLKNEFSGAVVPVGDVDGLVTAAVRVLTNKDVACRYRTEARKSVVESLDVNCCVNRHLDIYRRL